MSKKQSISSNGPANMTTTFSSSCSITDFSFSTDSFVNSAASVEHTAATGNGPVNALDTALRKALLPFYPRLKEMKLLDFKVRVLSASDGTGGTASVVRVLIESGDADSTWVTVGVSHDIIEASWQGLVDSVVYKLYRDEEGQRKLRDLR